MRRVLRSRAVGFSAVAACCFLSAAPAAASAPADPDPGADLAVSGVALRPAATGDRDSRDRRDSRENAAAVGRETFDYVVTVTNRGPSAARQVRVTDRLPPSLEFASSRDGCTASGRTVVCGPLATLAVGASHAWVITVRLAADYRGDGADIVNEAVVDGATPDPDPRNNSSSLTGLKIPPSARTADLSIRKTAVLAKGREHVRPGEKFTYLITVRNEGPATARQLRVTDRLPSSLVLLSSPDDCAVAKGGDRLVVCPPLERLAAGAEAEFRITVRAVAEERAAHPPADMCTPIENVARVTSASFDPDLSDNANEPGTTGPKGDRLCLVSEGDGDQHDDGREDGRHDDREDGGEDGHHGRPDQHGPDQHDGRHDGRDHGQHHDGPEHHSSPEHHDAREQHGGRGDLADSGATVPGWLLWTSAALMAGGAALRTAFRVRRP
ncbi:hypothetical protein ACFXDJ_13895 [Streptomyces sp. NPDC059443]|uniref:hypothetical protein n=1 Tax=unclassified Streptomyces TaxID=2593676 RepID=UPI0036C9D6B5